MRKLKVLKSDMETPFQCFKMELGKKYVCEDFDPNPDKTCSKGFYATDIEGLTASFNEHKNSRVFECEVGGQSVIINQYKQRFETIELIRELKRPEIRRLARAAEPKLGYKLCEAIYPKNPLLGRPKKVTEREIELLNQWISVRASVVRDSVRDSVWASVVWDSVGASVVWDSVRDSVGASVGSVHRAIVSVSASVVNSVETSVVNSVGTSVVWDSVRDSVWASVGSVHRAIVSVSASVGSSVGSSVFAYMSSLFPNVKKWKYIDHPEGTNPFQSCIDLWHSGFVPCFDGKTWRLHSGKGAKIVYEMKI